MDVLLYDVSSELSTSEFTSSVSSYSEDSTGCFLLKGFDATWWEEFEGELIGDKEDSEDEDNGDNDDVKGDFTEEPENFRLFLCLFFFLMVAEAVSAMFPL